MVANQDDAAGAGRVAASFTRDEEAAFRELARSPNVYERLVASIAPSISGE